METGRGHGGVMRGGPGGKKMRKRKELDALVGGVGVKRTNGGSKRPGSGGVSPQDQLLSESTCEEEYWSSAKGGNCGKGRRHYNATSSKRRSRACTALLRLCTILLIMACLVATITVMWLFIDIKEQTTYLRSQLDQVSAGNEGIPDAIQKCHNLTSELKNNQTQIIAQLQQVAQRLTNFSNMISGIQSGLANVEKKLNDSPDLVTIPKAVKSLMSSVASIGGHLTDFNITTAKVSTEQKKISEQIENIYKNLSHCYDDIQDLQKFALKKISPPIEATKENISKVIIDSLKANVTSLNSTTWQRFKWNSEDHKSFEKNINELKDQIAYWKSHTLTIEKNQMKFIEEFQNQTEKNFNECKELVRNVGLQVTNISSKLLTCMEICHSSQFPKSSTTNFPGSINNPMPLPGTTN